jgi:hypothetical protein
MDGADAQTSTEMPGATEDSDERRAQRLAAKTYKDIVAEILEIGAQFTLEIDCTPCEFNEYVMTDALEVSDCVRLFQGHVLRKSRRNYYAYMSNSDLPRPNVKRLEEMFDRACDAEAAMRAEGLLDCPYCTPC